MWYARVVCWGLLIYAAWHFGKMLHSDDGQVQLKSGLLAASAFIGMVYLALQMPA